MMGWRLTSVTLLSVCILVHGRPSLLGSVLDGGHYGDHVGDHHGNSRHQVINGVTVLNVEPLMLNADGSYSYRYELSDGTFAFANALADGEITGGFGYRDTEDKDIAVDWTAGKVGFVPSGAHLAAGIGGAAQSLSYDYDYNALSGGGDYDVETYVDNQVSYVHEEISAEPYVHEEILAEPYVHEEILAEPYVHQEETYVHKEIEAEPYIHQDIAAEAYAGEGDSNADKSFGFQFVGKEYNREETADAEGTVQGHYSFIDVDGVERNVNYRAGAGIGFVPEADFFPVNPEVDAAFSSSASAINPSYYFEYKSNDASRVEDAMDGVVRGSYAYKTAGGNDINVQYSAGSKTGFVIENSNELATALENVANEPVPAIAKPYSGEIAQVEFVGPNIDHATWEQDQSFKFGFDASDHSRKEESDANGNVRGSYNFKNENGDDIEVKYTAGAETGFVVENLDEVLAKSLPKDSTHIDLASNNIVVQSNTLPNSVHSKKEFTAPPFSIEISTSLHGSPSTPLPSYSEPSSAPVSQPDNLYGAPSESLPVYNEAESAASATVPAAIPMMIMNPNYIFAYSNDDSSRTEDANPNTGIITGQYSYTNPEGNEIGVKYRAGADIGFIIENQDDLNAIVLKATQDGAAVLRDNAAATASSISTSYAAADPLPIASSSPHFISAPSNKVSTGYAAPVSNPNSLYGAPSKPHPSYNEAPLASYNDYVTTEASAPSTSTTGMVMDASFNFAVEEDDHSFREETDVNGERTGSYSYINPDGKQIQVRYRAGRDGFVILNPGEVLPKAPVHNV